MGNRAVITLQGTKTGIYLHWNGGRDSVEAFLAYAKEKGVRGPESDPTYGTARLCQIIGNFFGGTLSVGVGALSELDCDNGDNGLYIVGPGWEIVERKYNHGEQRGHDPKKLLQAVRDANEMHYKEEE